MNELALFAGAGGGILAGKRLGWRCVCAVEKSQATHDRNSRPLSEQIGGSLNPTWVEWLMGWPLGWTDLSPLETDRCHNAPHSHGKRLVVSAHE